VYLGSPYAFNDISITYKKKTFPKHWILYVTFNPLFYVFKKIQNLLLSISMPYPSPN
jgi:ABC-type polysaccharide/polyol phosphate export permease